MSARRPCVWQVPIELTEQYCRQHPGLFAPKPVSRWRRLMRWIDEKIKR